MGIYQRALDEWEDFDQAIREGMMALHYATFCYEEVVNEMIAYLLDSGAYLDVVYYNSIGTPLELACENQNFRAAIALSRAGAALTEGLLIQCVSSIETKDAEVYIPKKHVREFAVLQRTLIQELVHGGARLNWRPRGEGQTALMRAICEGEVSTVRHLLDLGANQNSRGGFDRTALMCSVENRNVQCVKMLIEAGADVNLVDVVGTPALYSLPPQAMNKDVAKIWVSFLEESFKIEEEFWDPEYGSVSIFELAIYEALQGRYLALDLIVEHSNGVEKLCIMKVMKALSEAEYNPDDFLKQLAELEDWDPPWGDIESEITLRDLQLRIRDQRHQQFSYLFALGITVTLVSHAYRSDLHFTSSGSYLQSRSQYQNILQYNI
ncbi:hypothetical protein THAR02_10819 [Trichoderma harzianum]|uniref:Uncharacterized protein n=1 Tax=Trichoderma harzianum TaxID=5544 RepID=A0A0F9WVB9_TRIHA|nr:hypothetical protein THAR02_10819 [Trichoderma harzianum]